RGVRVHITSQEKHPHRSWKEIESLIQNSSLKNTVKDRSLTIFSALAHAEAKVHNCSPEDVHFHEVGGVDSIIDIVGAAIGLDFLGIEKLISSPLPMTRGWVNSQHGKLPLPAPATCELLKNIPVYGVDLDQELVTPTGAAIIISLCSEFGNLPAMTLRSVGYGAGSRKLSDGRPNLFRLMVGKTFCPEEVQEVEVIETHIDDWSPEGYPYLNEQLFSSGALDVAIIPIQMKKGRPGFILRVIADSASALELKRLILSETTAIGLRYHTEKRMTLPRTTGFVKTCWGKIAVKKVETPAGIVLQPEYEACRLIAKKENLPLRWIYTEISKINVYNDHCDRRLCRLCTHCPGDMGNSCCLPYPYADLPALSLRLHNCSGRNFFPFRYNSGQC
ncbi:MAG: nickel pincer cofactor biosynthesis protein LarC, partial [Deltaproteobacteria bacterium]|nr:nickel pincer cofactor biosynthesis protein LarC [Deltaproteobacteria bacterium]